MESIEQDVEQQGAAQYHLQSAHRRVAYAGVVVHSHKVAYPHAHCHAHTVVDHPNACGKVCHYLMSRLRVGAEPSCEDGADGERRHLHAALHRCGQPHAAQLRDALARDAAPDEGAQVFAVRPLAGDTYYIYKENHEARGEGGYCRSHDAQLGKSAQSEDKQEVPDDVPDVAYEYRPHRHLGLRDAVEETFERAAHAHKH